MELPARRQTYESPRQLARRAAILQATRDLLTKSGYEGTTVRDVAELAQVAKGTLYNIYGGKDELIFAAVIDVRDDIAARALDLEPIKGVDAILKSNQAVLEEIVRTPNYTEAIAHALFGSPPAKMLVPSLIENPMEVTRTEIEAAKELGQIEADADSKMVARQLEMQRWGLILAVSVGQMTIDELTREVTHGMVRVLQSISRPKGRRMLEKYLLEFE